MSTIPGSHSADTLSGTSGAELILGEAGDDLLRGLGGADTLLGGDGADTLTGQLAAATLTGGTGADLFGIVLPDSLMPLLDPSATMTRITDFSYADGDRLRLALASNESPPPVYPPGYSVWDLVYLRVTFASHVDGPRGYMPLVWTGNVAGNAPTPGMALPGEALGPFGYLASSLADPLGGGWLILDLTGDGQLGAGDRVVRFDAAEPLQIGPLAFQGTVPIQARIGTEAGEVLHGSGLPDPGPPSGPVSMSLGLIDNALDDMLSGGGGDDTLRGGAGADVLVGGEGADRLVGGSGGDTYHVDDLRDRVVEWEDVHVFLPPDHVLASVFHVLGAHVEMLTLLDEGGAIRGAGNALANAIAGNAHANRLLGRGGNDTLRGGGGDDSVFGEAGDDQVFGDDGDDLLGGGLGADSMSGGAGNDRLRGEGGADMLSGNDGNDWIAGADGDDTLDGGEGNDRLLGGTGNDVLSGGRGLHDTLLGGDGADTLHGAGEGVVPGDGDRLVGDLGNDYYSIESPGDVAVEFLGQGADTIAAYLDVATYTLPDAFEGLIFGGQMRTAIGNAADNAIAGSHQDERLEGRDGADTLTGERGSDTLLGGAGADLFDFVYWHGGNDVILDFEPGVDRLRLADWRFDDASVLYALTEDIAAGALLRHDPFNPAAGTMLLAGVAKSALLPGDLVLG
ncbi:MAG TPA: calcium-binding protein [Falsiroseomonas sp.]|jgi:Ca2+-binding RTX toxin-like protein|nr:calcium-binding protein [Falsiroseomonas sp.]